MNRSGFLRERQHSCLAPVHFLAPQVAEIGFRTVQGIEECPGVGEPLSGWRSTDRGNMSDAQRRTGFILCRIFALKRLTACLVNAKLVKDNKTRVTRVRQYQVREVLLRLIAVLLRYDRLIGDQVWRFAHLLYRLDSHFVEQAV